MPTPNKSFAKAFFEDIKETAPVDNTRTEKPKAVATQTAKAKAENDENQAKADWHSEQADILQNQTDGLKGTEKDTAVGTHGEKWSSLSQMEADAQKELAKDYSDKTRVGKAIANEEKSQKQADKFERNLHKYDKGAKMKRELREMDGTPELLKRPKQKSFAKKFFEDID